MRADLHCCVSALTRLLRSHPALSEEPESGRDAESPADLWFPHRCGVCFFVPCIFINARPAKTFPTDKSVSVFYTVITSMLNPLIYSLRNSELTNAMKKLWKRNIVSHSKKCITQHEGSHLTSGFIYLECKSHFKIWFLFLFLQRLYDNYLDVCN